MIEQIFESLLSSSLKFKEVMQSLEKMLQNLAQMAKTLFDLSQLVQAHNEAIHQIMASQQSIVDLFQQMDPLFIPSIDPDAELN